jgi:hypothetical protein
MTDELAHVGQRRNFLGGGAADGSHDAQVDVSGLLPRHSETNLLFDVEQMVKDGKTFDYSTIAPQMIERSWVPSYCKT